MSRHRIASLLVAAAVAALAWALPATAREDATTVAVTAGKPSELRFTLVPKTAPRGVVVFKVTNRGLLMHDFKIAGKKTKRLAKGQSATLRLTLKAGRYPFLCTVTGHAAGGMKGVFVVK